jgi:hypothetical protein
VILFVVLTETRSSHRHMTAAEMYNAINKHQLRLLSDYAGTTERKVAKSCCDKEYRLHNTVVSICTPLSA